MTPDWTDARAWAEAHAQSWFMGPADAALVVQDIPIGWPLQVDAFNAFLRVATAAAGLDRGQWSITGLAKRTGFDRALRTAGLRAQALRSSSPAPRAGIDAMFVTEVPTPSMLDPSIRVARAMQPGTAAALTADPRAAAPWRRAGFEPARLLLSFREERALIREGRAEARAAWRAYVASRPSFDFAGTDVTDATLNELAPLVLNSAPWLGVEASAISQAIARWQPTHLVVATDQHRIGRLAVRAATGTPTVVVVLQHGLPQTPIGFLPLVANRIHVWSPGIRDWFVAHGADSSRIVISGNPRLDDIREQDRDAARREIDAQLGPVAAHAQMRLLVPLSPMGTEMNLAVLRIVIEAMRREAGLYCVIKLHPGSGVHEPITDLIAASPDVSDRLRVMRYESLPTLLLWGDVTFLFRSTVGLESLAAGTPVVVADTGRPSIADDEMGSLSLPRAASGRALVTHLHELTTAPGRGAFIAERRAAIERLAGPTDGRSAIRIATLLGKARHDSAAQAD